MSQLSLQGDQPLHDHVEEEDAEVPDVRPAANGENNQEVANVQQPEIEQHGEVHQSVVGSSTQTSHEYDNIEVTFTEKEVLKKISDLKDKLKIRAASVRKPTQFDDQKTDIKDFVADFDNYRDVIGLQKMDCYATFLSYLGEKHKNKLRNLNKSPGEKEDWDTVKYDIIDALTPPAQK